MFAPKVAMDIIILAHVTVALWWLVVRAMVEIPQAIRQEKREK